VPQIIQHIEDLVNQGRYFEARAKAEDALQQSNELRLKQLYALSLSKAGVPEAALEFMEPVYREFPEDPESAGILGSINKELFKKNQSTPFAIRSRDTYFKNFTATKSYYTGINAASMSAMAGQASRGREIANQVISILEGKANDFWELATLGEAHLLTKNRIKSTEYYVQARKRAGNDWGKITSVHNQLWLLNHFLPVSGEVMKMFKPPVVTAFVGHMIDHPSRSTPRFPAVIEQSIKDAITNSIRTLNAHIGYCSVACGGDILFAEAMAEQGGEVNIFIPFDIPDFIQTSLAFAGDHWVKRFEALVEKFPIHFVTHEAYAGFDDLFAFQSKLIFGSAVMRSSSSHAEPYLLTVLSDVDLKRKEGGTRDTIRLWPYPQNHININPDIYTSSITVEVNPNVLKPIQFTSDLNRPVLYLAYCDLTGISLLEREKVFKAIHLKIDDETVPVKAFALETDSFLAAYETEISVMEFVSDVLNSIKALKQVGGLKMALHAGPVHITTDANSEDVKVSGETVDIVRQIGKLTPAGSICATNNFSSLLALETIKYSLDYSGVLLKDSRGEGVTVYRVGIKNIY
jgi:tetratricopeptide (TPR) repeat protein